MGFWKDFGTSAADIGINVVGGLANGYVNQMFADHARAENFRFNELAADNADARQRAQFRDLYSYPAQVKQMKEAGLNPALMYGGASGQGGASAPQGMGAGGVQAGYSPMDLMSIAQIENINADTEGKKIENQNKQDTINADIALKLSQAGLNKASQAYTETQNIRAQIASRIEGATEGIEIEKVMSEADLLYWESFKCQYEAKSAEKQYDFDVDTYTARVKTIAAEYTKLLTDIKEGNSRIQLNQATIDKMANDIAVNWFNAKVGFMSYAAQEKWYKEQIEVQLNKLEQDKELTLEQIKAMKQGQWLKFATDIFGSICNIGAAATHALLTVK